MGLFPEDVRDGDWICIVHGAETPSVFHKQEETCRLIGECYLRGAMNGEALGLEDVQAEWRGG